MWSSMIIRHSLFTRTLFRNRCSVFPSNKPHWTNCFQRGLSSLLLAAATISFSRQSDTSQSVECERNNSAKNTGPTKIQPPDPNTLTDTYLIKSSAVITVNSICTLLSQTAEAIINEQNEYIKAVKTLIALKELQLKTSRGQNEEDKLWDAILEIRAEINKHKQNKENLEILLSYVEKMLTTAAEVAYISGAEYSSVSANEKLYSVKTYLEQTKQSSSDVQLKLAALEAKIIEAVSKNDKDDIGQD